MNKKLQILKYISLDIVAAALVWTLFFIYRKTYVEPIKYGYHIPIEFDDNFYYALILIPIYWVFIYFIIAYNSLCR